MKVSTVNEKIFVIFSESDINLKALLLKKVNNL